MERTESKNAVHIPRKIAIMSDGWCHAGSHDVFVFFQIRWKMPLGMHAHVLHIHRWKTSMKSLLMSTFNALSMFWLYTKNQPPISWPKLQSTAPWTRPLHVSLGVLVVIHRAWTCQVWWNKMVLGKVDAAALRTDLRASWPLGDPWNQWALLGRQSADVHRPMQIVKRLVTIKVSFQEKIVTLREARFSFDIAILRFSHVHNRLGAGSVIVENGSFETSISKIQLHWHGLLTDEEQSAVRYVSEWTQKDACDGKTDDWLLAAVVKKIIDKEKALKRATWTQKFWFQPQMNESGFLQFLVQIVANIENQCLHFILST